MEVLLVIAVGFVCMASFLMGAKLGQQVTKGEEIKVPSANPVQAVRDHIARKEAEIEQNKFDTILQNIEKYDGTTKGQEDVP
jgi:hypothetical protein